MWTRGPYGGEGWRIEGGRFVLEHGLAPLSTVEVQLLRERISRFGGAIVRAARAEKANPRMIGAIGWAETGLRVGLSSSVGATGPFGILPSTAAWLEGRAVSQAELQDWEFSARLCGRYLLRAGRAVGWGADNPLSFPVLLSCYNAGFGEGRVRRSDRTPFRMVYDAGHDGGYIPRALRAWNALPAGWPPLGWFVPALVGVGCGLGLGWLAGAWQGVRG